MSRYTLSVRLISFIPYLHLLNAPGTKQTACRDYAACHHPIDQVFAHFTIPEFQTYTASVDFAPRTVR